MTDPVNLLLPGFRTYCERYRKPNWDLSLGRNGGVDIIPDAGARIELLTAQEARDIKSSPAAQSECRARFERLMSDPA